MAIRIFKTQRNSRQAWLAVNDDRTITYHVENVGSRLMRDGLDEQSRTLSGGEAKSRWPSYAKSIDVALAEASHVGTRPSVRAGFTDDNTKVHPSEPRHAFYKWWPGARRLRAKSESHDGR